MTRAVLELGLTLVAYGMGVVSGWKCKNLCRRCGREKECLVCAGFVVPQACCGGRDSGNEYASGTVNAGEATSAGGQQDGRQRSEARPC